MSTTLLSRAMLKIRFELQASTELASRYVHDVAWANFLTNPYGKSPNVKADVEAQIKEACRTIRYVEHGNKTLDELGAATVIVRSTVHDGGSDPDAPSHICAHVLKGDGEHIKTKSPLTGVDGDTHHFPVTVETEKSLRRKASAELVSGGASAEE
ncbi:hypothetical protein TRAPUB_5046 [Trametes pubescens]|uniref:Uncharacterized protein n=1 Tax=Trametes pubescens TaxID=154538 RepID=A0A1M2V9M0_TRAPU|nr:hypothetical protein TRAPUB_5046 [Trametes pubescens]